jgi:hypothetical protein
MLYILVDKSFSTYAQITNVIHYHIIDKKFKCRKTLAFYLTIKNKNKMDKSKGRFYPQKNLNDNNLEITS